MLGVRWDADFGRVWGLRCCGVRVVQVLEGWECCVELGFGRMSGWECCGSRRCEVGGLGVPEEWGFEEFARPMEPNGIGGEGWVLRPPHLKSDFLGTSYLGTTFSYSTNNLALKLNNSYN